MLKYASTAHRPYAWARAGANVWDWSPSLGGEGRLAMPMQGERHYNEGRLSSGTARSYHEDAEVSARR